MATIIPVQTAPQVGYVAATTRACPFSSAVTPGNYVLVYVVRYVGADIVDVSVGPTAGVLIASANAVPPAAFTEGDTSIWLVGPVVSGDPTVTFDSDQHYSSIRADEFSGVGSVEFVLNGDADAPPCPYPALSTAGCLAVSVVVDQQSGGDTWWVPPTGYTRSLNISAWDTTMSGASAWRVLPSADADTVTWGQDPGNTGSQALAIFAPSADGPDHEFTTVNLSGTAAVLGTPSLSSNAALTPVSLVGTAAVLGNPSVGSKAVLAAQSVVAGAPLLGTPALASNHALTPVGLTGGVPVLGNPSVGSEHTFAAQSVTAGAPLLGAPALGASHALAPTSLSGTPAELGTPTIAFGHALTATSLVGGAPLLGTPALNYVAPTGPPVWGFTIGPKKTPAITASVGARRIPPITASVASS